VYPLPAGGEIKQWSGRICPVEGCGFELCLYEVGSPGRTFPLCPFCFNSFRWSLGDEEDRDDQGNLDKEDAHKERQIKRTAGKKLVLECPLPDDHPLVKELTVSPDPDGGGVMIIDARFGPKWRLVSTRDATIVYLPKSIEKVTVLEETDNILGCHKMKVEFKPGQSPLTGGESSYTCFFPTDQVLQDQSRVFHGSERTASSGRGKLPRMPIIWYEQAPSVHPISQQFSRRWPRQGSRKGRPWTQEQALAASVLLQNTYVLLEVIKLYKLEVCS
jgi:DNA topoisomerase III